MSNSEKVGVIGLGHVGLPVALAFAEHFPTVGYDSNLWRVDQLRCGMDFTGEHTLREVENSKARWTHDPADLRECTVFIVAVPTPLNRDGKPDLEPLRTASTTVGRAIQKGALVVIESSVFPGTTEEICGPIIVSVSRLQQGIDFKLGYSPERINPGDKAHTLVNTRKVIAAEDAEALNRMSLLYGSILKAIPYEAKSIKVAEAAKLAENIQRDVNIALANELAMIYDRLGIHAKDVFDAASSKWNYADYRPGLVGGHCIGVDTMYMVNKSERLRIKPHLMVAARGVNDYMPRFVAEKTVKCLIASGIALQGAKVAILGMTFKENVRDVRESKVPWIVSELAEYGITASVHDSRVGEGEAMSRFGLVPIESLPVDVDAVILAVPHREYLNSDFNQMLAKGGCLLDLKSALNPADLRDDVRYWCP